VDRCAGVVVLAVLVALAAVVPRGSIALYVFLLAVEPATFELASLGPIDGAVLVVVAEWVTAAHFLRAVRSVTVCRRLHPIACICIVVAVAWFNVVFTALISRNTEVSAPAIGAFDVALTTAFHRWAFHVDWMTEWTIVAVADLVILTAVWFLWAAPLTEASLHVAESIGPAFFGRRTWGAALALAEAIKSIEAGAIGITGWNFDIAIRDAVVDL